jgi:glycosyltransferase involved in cell wall biosynthesis
MKSKDRKIRILWCGESSFLNTGYAIYAKEVLKRLHGTGKYTIAEMGCYSDKHSHQIAEVPWAFYPTLPINQEEANAYNSNPKAQFGEWRFDDICLDFRPDVVIDIRDWWMMEYQGRSAFRNFFKWAIMPTVDSSPQQEQYLSTYISADAVFTYSEYGKEILEKETQGNIDVVSIPSPAADYELLKPANNKEEHRKKFGFFEDINIVGTIMRNQRRKLYPNLISSFRKMLDENPVLQGKTFLYIHTFHPDLGWDIPSFIKNNNMSNHTLLTYKCKSCLKFFPSFYSGALTSCQHCGKNSAVMPGTQFGVNTQELSQIINFFDLYVQYSVCEGFGMPQVEAAACGVPILTVDYSAMTSVGKNLKAEFIPLASKYWDSPTHSERAIPDDEQLKNKMANFLKKPKTLKRKLGMDSYIAARRSYDWNKSASMWENYLDTVEKIDHSETWDSPRKQYSIPHPQSLPKDLTNDKFVDILISATPAKDRQYVCLRMLRDLNYGRSTIGNASLYYDEASYINDNQSYSEFNRKDAYEKAEGIYNYYNMWEEKREVFSKNKGWTTDIFPEFLKSAKTEEE